MNHKVLVYQAKDGFVPVEAGATSAPKDDEMKEAKIDLSRWSLSINPRQEWKQMLREAWRLQRDFFYDRRCTALIGMVFGNNMVRWPIASARAGTLPIVLVKCLVS